MMTQRRQVLQQAMQTMDPEFSHRHLARLIMSGRMRSKEIGTRGLVRKVDVGYDQTFDSDKLLLDKKELGVVWKRTKCKVICI